MIMFLRLFARFPALFTAPLVVVLIAFWSVFAPITLGGQAVYVVISGNSMEPLYHHGDLVILLHADQAKVGDIFAYRYPNLGTVIHRLAARDGARFIFKGDHNTWNDGYHPEWNDLVGKAWFHIPAIGSALMWLRNPWPMAALIGGFFMFGLVFNSPGQTGKKKKKWMDWLKSLPAPSGFPERQNASLVGLSFFLLIGAVLAITSFSRPVTKTVDDNVDYVHSAHYSYSAPADLKVYDQATIQSGEPIYTQLTCKVDISLDYVLLSARTVDVKGSYRMLAVVSEFNGWKRTIELLPTTAFDSKDAAFHGAAKLDVCAIQQMVNNVAALTGLARPTYNLAVVTEIKLAGQVGGRAYEEKIAPTLNFGLDSSQLYVIRDDANGADLFAWKKMGLIPGARDEGNTIPVLGINLPVFLARIVSILFVLISLAGLGMLGLPLFASARQDGLAAIHLKYAHILILADEQTSGRAGASLKQVIDVKSIDNLARLAQNLGLLIMEKIVGEEHHFLVITQPYSYRYVLRVEPKLDAD